jgi:hypothetical protein
MIDAATRMKGVEQMIDQEQYIVIHAAIRSGKTTCLQDLADRLNVEGKYYVLYCSLESMQEIVDPKEGISGVIQCIQEDLRFSGIPHRNKFAQNINQNNYVRMLRTELTLFCILPDRPLVILFDKVDCLNEGTLISFLRQLRDGYNNRRMTPFVHSIALVGMHNICDFKSRIRPDSDSLDSASPFNIITKSLTLQNFTKEEIIRLYQQHTNETGQIFEADAIELVWKQTQGQPWLVNAIAHEVIVEILQSDYTQPVTEKLVHQAIQAIIRNRPTHIDSLLEQLKEKRVHKVIEPLITGEKYVDMNSDDFLFTKDLGLIRIENCKIRPANPIYAEVMIRKLSSPVQIGLQDSEYRMPRYLKPDGSINVDSLMSDFQQFRRLNNGIWLEKYDYPEAGPLLVMMAFLQHVINGDGDIVCEMATGSGCLDLLITYNGRKYPIEMKIRYGNKYLEEGIEQTAHRYMGIHDCNEGWMVVFDRRQGVPWKKKIYMRKKTVNGKTITVVGV